jgi:hypothetical protein
MKTRDAQNEQRTAANVQPAGFTKLRTPRYRRTRASSPPRSTANSTNY